MNWDYLLVAIVFFVIGFQFGGWNVHRKLAVMVNKRNADMLDVPK